MSSTWPYRGRTGLLFFLVMVVAILSACAAPRSPVPLDHPRAAAHPPLPEREPEIPMSAAPVLALAALPTLGEVLPSLSEQRLVYIGETHDRYSHHLAQLEIIRYLHGVDPHLAIGVEFFQQPFQPQLDAYIAGQIDERELLISAQYFKRWGYDYRLYAPIVRYAREHGLPLLALSAPGELIDAVREGGVDGLEPGGHAGLPTDIDRSDRDYERRVREVFHMHAHQGNGVQDFDRFLEVQLLWDEAMAERVADHVRRHPEHRLVILAGSGHVAFRSGIPRRVERRVGIDGAVVLIDWAGPLGAGLADYLLLPEARSLPPAGRMGAFLLDDDGGGVTVRSCAEGSACEQAGIQRGDRLLAVDGTGVESVGGVRALLWNRAPGERVLVTMRRDRLLLPPEEREMELELR